MAFVMRISITDVLRDGTLANYHVNGKACGYRFDVRLRGYRGHYLSTIDELEITTNGVKVAEQNITFCLNGKEFAVSELKHQVAEFWRIIEPATIMVHCPGGLPPGEYDIDLKLMLRCPYLPQPGATQRTYVAIDSCERKTLKLA